jgi:hypothetical protein
VTWVAPPVKAVGDTLYASDVNTLSGDVSFLSKPPLASAFLTTNPSIANNTSTVVKCDTRLVGTNVIYSPSTGLYTIKTAGVYQPHGQLLWASNASGQRQTQWLKNGTVYAVSITNGVSGLLTHEAKSPPVRLAANDTIQLNALQTSGGGLALNGTNQDTFSCIRWVSN